MKHGRSIPWKIAVMVIVACALPGALSAADESGDAEFLAGLRTRRLFQLAEDYCNRKLQQDGLPDVRRSELVTELSVTLVGRALHAASEEREASWRRAWEVTEQFAEAHPDHPRLLLVRTQGAMAQVARGELGRQESEVLADGDNRREQARSFLRQAIRTLGGLGELTAAALRERSMPGRHPTDASGLLTVFQLATLQKQIQYQTARALRNQALCYDADSADRADALAQALALLGQLAKLEPSDPLAWPCRIDEIVCLRLSKDYTAASARIKAAQALEPSAAGANRLRAERIRLALAAGQLAEATGTAAEVRGVSTPQLDYARLEAALAAWQAAEADGQSNTVEGWQRTAVALSEQIASAHGPYWSRRAKLLLAAYVKTASGGSNLDMWSQAAESAYLSGQTGEAVSTYDQAAEEARRQQDTDRAFQFAFLAATIQRDQSEHTDSLARYLTLAKSQPGHGKAPEAHRLAIEQAAQIAQSGTPGSFEAYVALLVEHLQLWPEGSAANDIRWQLGRVRQSQSRWAEAIAAFQSITPDFDRLDQVIEAVRVCYHGRLEAARNAGEPVAQIAGEAARWFELITFGPEGRPPERWSPRARAAVLSAAEFWLHDPPVGFDRAETILVAALSSADDAPELWRSATQSLRVCTLAGQGRRPEAAALLAQLSQGSTDRLLTVLEGLARMGEGTSEAVRRELAGLQLQTIDLVKRQGDLLSAEQLRSLQRLSARALKGAGRRADALAAYEQIASKYPNDGAVQEELAGLLALADDRRSVERAMGKWREIERRSPPGTERWFRAKYTIALLHYRLGDPEQARKMITLVQILHPELGGSKLKAQFQALLKQCGG